MTLVAVDPMHAFAVRSLASLDAPDGPAAMTRFRTALTATLQAAGIDMSNVAPQPVGAFASAEHYVLLVWYEVTASAIQLFAVPERALDDLTEAALDLLNGSMTFDLDELPIEDVDALTRVLTLMGAGAADARSLHAHLVQPRLDQFDDEFRPPNVADLEAMWGRIYPFYIGGTNAPPRSLDVWIARAYAFGVAA